MPAKTTFEINWSAAPQVPPVCAGVQYEPEHSLVNGSSLRMVPVAVAVPMVALAGAERVTVKPSFGSTVASALAITTIVCDEEPAGKVTVPLGKAPPTKSAAFAALAPEPVTAQLAVDCEARLPERATVKVKVALIQLPSLVEPPPLMARLGGMFEPGVTVSGLLLLLNVTQFVANTVEKGCPTRCAQRPKAASLRAWMRPRRRCFLTGSKIPLWG